MTSSFSTVDRAYVGRIQNHCRRGLRDRSSSGLSTRHAGGPTINPTLVGTIHFFVGAPAVFGLLPLSCFVLARRFAQETQWKGGAVYSVLTGILMIAFFVGFISTGIHDGPAGLMERFSIMIGMAWIALFALLLLRKTAVPG